MTEPEYMAAADLRSVRNIMALIDASTLMIGEHKSETQEAARIFYKIEQKLDEEVENNKTHEDDEAN